MTVIVGNVPPMRPLEKTHWTPSPPVSTDTLTVDFAPITHYEESSSGCGGRMPHPIPSGDSEIDTGKLAQLRHPTWFSRPGGCLKFDSKVEEGQDLESYSPAHGYYDPSPWSDWAYESDEFDDAEPGDYDASSFDGKHADVKKGGGFECHLPGPEYHDDPISSDDIDLSYYGANGIEDAFIDYFNSAGAIETDSLTPSAATARDGEDGLPPPGYDPQTGRRLCDYPGTQDHCECPNPWVSYDSEDPYPPTCGTYNQGVPSLTASSNRGASSRLHASSRSETAQVCSLLLLLLIVSLTLSSLFKYLESRAVAAGMPRDRAMSSKNANSKDGEEDHNPEPPLSYGFLMTFGYVFGVLLALSMTRDGDEVVLMACVFLGVSTAFWLVMNTVAVFKVIVYERPSWAIPILDCVNTSFNTFGKVFDLGYAKTCNVFLSVAWHLAFAIMLVAFTILMLADATMKSLSGSPDKGSTSKQEQNAASETQGKGNEKVEAEASTKPQLKPVWPKELRSLEKKLQSKAVALEIVAPHKMNPWLDRAEEARAKAESAVRASEASSEDSKVEPASGPDEWEMIEK